MAWLKIDQTLRDHHKICDAADELQVDPAHMTGMMVLLWLWAIDNAPSGSLAGVSAGTIARGAQYGGDPTAFVEALKRQELLDEGPDGLQIHDWEEHAGNLIDRRQKDAKRKAAERAAKKAAEPETSEGRPADVRKKSAPRVEQSKSRERVDIPSPSDEGEGEAPAADPIPIEKLRILWNDTCLSYSKANGVNGNRRTLMTARWKEHQDLDWWKAYFDRIEASSFLKGKNDRGWKATLDWILNAANMDKILEGKYDEEGGRAHGDDTDQRAAGDYTRGFKE